MDKIKPTSKIKENFKIKLSRTYKTTHKTMRKITHKITYKTTYRILLAAVLLSFIPLLFISKYNHMSADDYSYGLKTHKAWQESQSIVETVKAAGEQVADSYESWQGTFVSIFLMALQPGVFGEQYYGLGAVFLILLYAVSFYIFGHVMLTKLLHAEKYQAGIVTLIMLLLCTQWLQSPVQAFYFYNAGVHYIFMFSMLLLALCLQILLAAGTKKKIWCTTGGAALGFLSGGGNYITAFLYLLLFLSILFVSLLLQYKDREKRRNTGWQIFSLIPFLCSFLFSVIAPGNFNRGDKFEDVSPVKAIGLSFRYSMEGCNIWMTLSIVCIFLLLLPLVAGMVKNTSFSFPLPGLAVVYAYCLFAAMYAPTCYALGFPGAGRCRNIYRIVYYIMLLFDLIYVSGYIRHKIVKGGLLEAAKKAEAFFKNRIWLPFTLITAGFLFFMVLSDDWNSYTTLSAVKSVWEKEAQLYHVQSLERETILKTTAEKKVEIMATTANPRLLFFDDITTDPKDWRNRYMAKWYGKKKVTLIER